MNFIYLTVIKRILGIKRYDLRYLWNISRNHRDVLPRSTVANYKQCKSSNSVSNNWRHAASNPQGGLPVICLTKFYHWFEDIKLKKKKKLFSNRICFVHYIWIIKGHELRCVACGIVFLFSYWQLALSRSLRPIFLVNDHGDRVISFDLNIFSIILISWPRYLFHSVSKGDRRRSFGLTF